MVHVTCSSCCYSETCDKCFCTHCDHYHNSCVNMQVLLECSDADFWLTHEPMSSCFCLSCIAEGILALQDEREVPSLSSVNATKSRGQPEIEGTSVLVECVSAVHSNRLGKSAKLCCETTLVGLELHLQQCRSTAWYALNVMVFCITS